MRSPTPVDIDETNHPTIGSPDARVHVVVFIEPKCPDCKEFDIRVFSLLRRNYIDTGKIMYTVIPVSFLPNSMSAAVALLCVYNQDPGFPNADLFFNLLETFSRNEWKNEDEVLELAIKASPAIDLNKLKNCIDQQSFQRQIEENTAYGKKLQGSLTTPSVYVEGIRVDDTSYENIKAAIETILKS